MMKKGAKYFGLIVILLIIGSVFVGVVTAEETIIDTEISESRFTEYPSRPVIGWYYIFDHDTFHTKAYNDNFWYTLCGEKGHGDPFFGVWQASLPQSGDYEVFVWIPDPDPFVEGWSPGRTYTPTQSAVYQIYHKAGMTTKTVNQELRTGSFYSLGTFNFDTRASVILNDRTGESYLSTMVAFDAVKFVHVVAVHDMAVTNVYPVPSSPYVEQLTTIYVTVKNEGRQQENDVPIKAYVDGVQVGSTQHVTLSADESSTKSFSWTPSTAKTYSVKGEVGVVSGETETSDNTKTINVVVNPIAVHNMAVTNVYTVPASPYVEQSTTIHVTVKNEGSQQENDVPVKAYVDGSQVGSTQHVTLSAGKSTTKSFTWTPSTAKTYSVKGEVGIVSGETDTSDNKKTINVIVSTQPVCIPKLSIPLYAPAYQQAHNETELTYIIRVTNEGDAKGTIDLSVSSQSISESEEKWWDTQLLPPSVTLDPKKSEDVSLKVRINSAGDIKNEITIEGISTGDGSKRDTCDITAVGHQEIGLFGIKLRFNSDPEEHTLEIYPQNNAKASNKQITLSSSKVRYVSVVFDPTSTDDLKSAYNIDIKVKDTTMGGTIPIKFKEYDEIIASGFDVSKDGYRFPNWKTLNLLWSHCYGMSETSILNFIQEKEPSTYSITKDKARWRIGAYQIRWSNTVTLDNVKYSDIDKEEMAKDYEKIEKSIRNKKPIILFLIQSSEEKHAVVAYKIIKEGDKSYILIYENGDPYCVCEKETPYEICNKILCQNGHLSAYPYATFNLYEKKFYYQSYTKFKAVEAKELKRTEQVLSMMCPINTTITDQYGRIISDDGTNEIPGADMLLKNETKLFYLPTNLTYSAEIDAYDAGLFNFTRVSPVGNNFSLTAFENISVTASTKAFVEIAPNVTNYTMKIDYNGDGHIDEEKSPDVNESIEMNQPPIASFTYSPLHQIVNQSITFNASASYDPDGNITNYKWNFGDGNITNTTDPLITHTYVSAGDYTVNLTVTDDEGEYSYTENSTKVGSAKSDVDIRLNVPFFSQRATEWKDQKLGESTGNIGAHGCALTSAAMVSKYFGWDIDPLRLDAALTEIDGISTGGNLNWAKVEEASGGYVDWRGKMRYADWNNIDQELSNDNPCPCIINVHYKGAKGSHFVVIRGKVRTKYHFWDPADLPPGEDRIWPNGALGRTYTWGNTQTDPRIYLYHKGSLPSEKNPISVIDKPPYFYKWSNSGHLKYWRMNTCEAHTYYETYIGGMPEESGSPSKPDCWMEFTPYLQSAGKYWIYVGFCADSSRSTKVKYTIYPNGIDGSSKTVSVNQYSDKECWKEIKLGDTWDLSGCGKTHIVVTDATGEEYDKKKDLSVGTIKFRKAIIADTLNILTPTQTAYRNVGAHDKPIKTSMEVEIKTYNNAFAPGLTNKDDYTVKIGDKKADVLIVIQKSDRYVLEIMPPKQAGDGKYDLHVELGSLSDVENGAINYGTKGLDVTLIIDSSGSMRSNDPEGYRKTAAKYFVDLASTGDKICVADFGYSSCNSRLLLPLLEITDESSRDTVKTAIDQVVSNGRTPIGGGLEKGYDELSSPRAVAGHNKVGILLTDGNDTCGTEGAARTYAQKFGDNGWVLYTIGLTGDADEEDLLRELAALGNVDYKALTNEQLWEIYNALSGRVAGKQTMDDARGTAQQGSTSVENALIDSSVTEVKFTISWAGSNLNLTLKKPDGGIIDPDVAEADSNVIYTSASSYEFYTVQSPMPGEWELRIFGVDVPAGGEDYTASVMGTANLTMNMYFDRVHYSAGEPIKVSVSLTDALQPITEASVMADIEISPTASSSLKNLAEKDTLQNRLSIAQDQITLFDDGMHGDGMANDGVYANFYTNTNIEGTYKFTAKATGTRSPEEFERVIEQSIYVSGALTPDFSVTPTPRLTLVPRPTLTLAPRPTLTPNPRPTLRPTATLFEKIEGLTAAIRVGVGGGI